MGLFSKSKKKEHRGDEVPETAKSFSDSTNRFPVDQLLRKNGYQIYSRIGKEPTWMNNNTGEIVSQSEALKRVHQDDFKIEI